MSGWQPIETAPKDGTAVLLFVPFAVVPGKKQKTRLQFMPWRVNSGFWCVAQENELHPLKKRALDLTAIMGGYWAFDKRGRRPIHCRPTHWMPLPEPPQS